MISEELWTNALEFLKSRLPRQAFDTWFGPTRLIEAADGKVKVSVPNQFFAEWLQHHYLRDILFALKSVSGKELNFAVEFIPTPEMNRTPPPQISEPPFPPPPVQFRLRSRYTFENFIVGEGNRLAWAAARNVAQNLGKAFNPLFIYGGVGLGKTHLLHAIGNAAIQQYPNIRIWYTPAESLFLELIQAIEKNTRIEFKEKYRGLDLLLLDDVHYLVGKESLQEEIFYTFNALHDAGSQVVFTSDRPPKDIPTLQERLISRLGSGLVVDIQPPDLETRIAILLHKAKQERFDLPEEIACYIAQRVRSNIRTLESSLIRLIAMHSLNGAPLTLELAESAIRDLVHPEEPISGDKVLKVVSEHFKIPIEDLRGTSRTKRVAFARQICMYLMRTCINLSLKDIGFYLGGKDHTTVIHAIEKIEQLKSKDPKVSGLITTLSKKINNPIDTTGM